MGAGGGAAKMPAGRAFLVYNVQLRRRPTENWRMGERGERGRDGDRERRWEDVGPSKVQHPTCKTRWCFGRSKKAQTPPSRYKPEERPPQLINFEELG